MPKELSQQQRAELICGVIFSSGTKEMIETGRIVGEVLIAIDGVEF